MPANYPGHSGLGPLQGQAVGLSEGGGQAISRPGFVPCYHIILTLLEVEELRMGETHPGLLLPSLNHVGMGKKMLIYSTSVC